MQETKLKKKSAVVAIVGRPSAGKSTLMNYLCGQKVAITSPVPQTTRNRIRGILTTERGQLIFIDTPGYHKSEKKFNLRLKTLVEETFGEVDMVLYVIDTSRTPGEEEELIAQRVARFPGPVLIALNKIDVKPNQADQHESFLNLRLAGKPRFRISSVTGEGVPALVQALFDAAPEGDILYPEEFYTDQDPDFRIAEIIREKAVMETRQEVPHYLYVEIADIETLKDGSLWVRAFLVVERESQKGILIGKGGSKIKTIRLAAEAELSEIFPYPVRLDIRVKVDPKWRQNDTLLKKLFR
ncbi:MAG TPA: GTPase Era [Spirochaetales bacterium]|nr:GTPase Era [Spirochaetales bacterium]